ncbi:MAG: hypothetical protein P8X55_08195 [Desulfosarcinaceae bacterium]
MVEKPDDFAEMISKIKRPTFKMPKVPFKLSRGVGLVLFILVLLVLAS